MFKKIKNLEISKRLFVTIIILLVYFIGRTLLVSYIDKSAYDFNDTSTQDILSSLISGDRYQYTVFALGITPNITASLIVQIFMLLRGKEFRRVISPQKTKYVTLIIAFIISVFMAISCCNNLIYVSTNINLSYIKAVSVVEMVVGSLIIYAMLEYNKEYGVGGQTPIIIINTIDNVVTTIKKYGLSELEGIFLLSILIMVSTLVLQKVTLKMPVQRVSIHNEYSDKSYIEFKLFPVGVMPLMFAVSFFSLVQSFFDFLLVLFKGNKQLSTIKDSLNLNCSFGIWVYLLILFTLSIVLSFIMLSPTEMADNLQKGGDSIVGIYAGQKTTNYIKIRLVVLSVISGIVMSSVMGISLFMALSGKIEKDLAMFPSTLMFMTGSAYSLFEEIKTYIEYDMYRFFI